jgi:formate hydrogenlyase subunit 3/multisubunit Na+/H+ antiporter MnhD subunit
MITLLAIYLPFFLAPVMLWRRMDVRGRQVIAVVSTAPALWLAVAGPIGSSVVMPWLFLEAHFGIDPIRQVFLLLTALLWAAAGLFAGAYLEGHPRARIFYFLYLLTMSGNIGLVVAEDIVSFYTFFALMTFAAYGLILFDGSDRAVYAARVYIIMAVIGEALILGAIFLTVREGASSLLSSVAEVVAQSPVRNLIIALVLGGFGVKAGLLGVHMWLPLAHPVAPTPASAVLSGSMIKAGLIGWMHFLPLGVYDSEVWSVALIVGGLLAAFLAAAAGVGQREPKTNLAYSSISQMGVMTMAVGVGLVQPDAWPVVMPVLAVYALSHGLAKGTLFLGVGIARSVSSRTGRILTMGGLTLSAAAIAGAPLTGGAIVKKALSEVVALAPGSWADRLEWLLVLSAIATTILLGRFLHLVWKDLTSGARTAKHPSIWWSWIFCLALVAVAVWVAIPHYAIDVALPGLTFVDVWSALWPVFVGIALLMGWWYVFRFAASGRSIPAGDLLIPIEHFLRLVVTRWRATGIPGPGRWAINFEPLVERLVESERKRAVMSLVERRLQRWEIAGLCLVVFMVTLAALMFLEYS